MNSHIVITVILKSEEEYQGNGLPLGVDFGLGVTVERMSHRPALARVFQIGLTHSQGRRTEIHCC